MKGLQGGNGARLHVLGLRVRACPAGGERGHSELAHELRRLGVQGTLGGVDELALEGGDGVDFL